MTLTPRTVRLDLKCGKGSISKGEKCHKGAATQVSTKPSLTQSNAQRPNKRNNNTGAAIALVAYAGFTAAGLYQIKNIRQAYGQKFDPAQRYTDFTGALGDPKAAMREIKFNNKQAADSMFGNVRFGTLAGKDVVVKEISGNFMGAAQVHGMEIQGIISPKTAEALRRAQSALQVNEVQAAQIAGDLGFGPKLRAAGDNKLITDVAKGRPLLTQDRLLRQAPKLQQQLAENPGEGYKKLLAIQWKGFTKGTELSDLNKTRVLENMAKMHTAGISHNDLHPGNIFISHSGAQFIDFGTSDRGGASVSAEFVRMMNPPRFGLAQGGGMGYNLRSIDPSGYSATEKRLRSAIGKRVGKLTAADIHKAVEKSTDKAKLENDLQSIIDDFYLQFSRRSRTDSAFNSIVSMTPSTLRTDAGHRCGKGYIAAGKRCQQKGAFPTGKAIAIGLGATALTAGAIALTRSRRGGPKPPGTSSGPTAPPPSPTPSGPSAPRAPLPSSPKGPARLPGAPEPYGLLPPGRRPKSKTQRMHENTQAAMRRAEQSVSETTREEIRRLGRIGNAMADLGEAAGMATKTRLREVRLRTEAARRRFEPGYRRSPAAAPQQLAPGNDPALDLPFNPAAPLTPESVPVQRDPRTGQPRRRRARGFGPRRDSGLISFSHPVYIDPAR